MRNRHRVQLRRCAGWGTAADCQILTGCHRRLAFWRGEGSAPYAWSRHRSQNRSNHLAATAVTEDAISEGYEVIQCLADPQLALDAHASDQNPTQQHRPGTNLSNSVVRHGAARMKGVVTLTIWWGGAGNETALFQWNNNIGSSGPAHAQEAPAFPTTQWRFQCHLQPSPNFSEVSSRESAWVVRSAGRTTWSSIIHRKRFPTASRSIWPAHVGPAERTSMSGWAIACKLSERGLEHPAQRPQSGSGQRPDSDHSPNRMARRQVTASRLAGHWSVTNTFSF